METPSNTPLKGPKQARLSEHLQELKSHENLTYAIVGGLLISLIGAILWAVMTVLTEYQIGFMAIALGLLVGYGIRFFGAGTTVTYSVIGAIYSLLACVWGNLFGQVGFIANAEMLGYFETLTYLDLDTTVEIMSTSFNPMDIIFYGIAVYEGYRFSTRPIPISEVTKGDLRPQYDHLRLPGLLVGLLILGTIMFQFKGERNGPFNYSYDSGEKMIEGQYKSGREDGEWKFYYESGQLSKIGSYESGLSFGEWKWFHENSLLSTIGSYKDGLEDGLWMSYYESGQPLDSSYYSGGRLNGMSYSFYENGKFLNYGNFINNKKEGIWKSYYPGGNLLEEGFYVDGLENGTWTTFDSLGNQTSQYEHSGDGRDPKILNYWDSKGNHLVKDGTGTLKYYVGDQVTYVGRVEGGIKVGVWKAFFSNGKLKEIGNFKNDGYIINESYNEKGEVLVENGNGYHYTYYDSGSVESEGEIVGGRKNGKWLAFMEGYEFPFSEVHYVNGKMNGESKTFNSDGTIAVEGDFTNDIQSGKWKWYNYAGMLENEVEYVDGEKHGEQIFYSENGVIIKKEIYENGQLINIEM